MGLLFWEVVDLLRRLVLTSIILFVDTEHGSGKMLRLVLGALVSAMYLGILALARPYRRPDDLYLACLSNILLACCFVSGIAIKLCEEGSWASNCYDYTSFANSYWSTLFVIILTCIMLLASVGLVAFKTISAVTAPTLYLISSGRAPILDLQASCHFHIFISHGVCTYECIYMYTCILKMPCASMCASVRVVLHRIRDSTPSFLSSKQQNASSRLAQDLAHIHEQRVFTYSAYVVAAGHR